MKDHFGAQNRTRTCTSLNTRTWNERVYQFRHLGFRQLWIMSAHAFLVQCTILFIRYSKFRIACQYFKEFFAKKSRKQSCSLPWSGKRDSNSRPRPWQGRALPTELLPHYVKDHLGAFLSESECKGTAFFWYDQIFWRKNSKKVHFLALLYAIWHFFTNFALDFWGWKIKDEG